MGKLGVGFSGTTSASGTIASSTPIYQTIVGAGGTNTITVPAAVMTCSDNTLVSIDGAIQNTGFTRAGNVYTFLFTIPEGIYVLFKN